MFFSRYLIYGFLIFACGLRAEETPLDNEANINKTLQGLERIDALKTQLEAKKRTAEEERDRTDSETDKKTLDDQVTAVSEELKTVNKNFELLAAGNELERLDPPADEKFNFQDELISLVKPVMKELKDMTKLMRRKTQLREKLAFFDEVIPIAKQSIAHLESIRAGSKQTEVNADLDELLSAWNSRLTFIQSEREAAQIQLDRINSEQTSFTESSRGFLKRFFKKRGLYLVLALLAALAIFLLSRLSYRFMKRLIPGYRRQYRSFRLRLVDLVHRFVTVVLMIAGPMLVFYLFEDWVLFSIGILVLFSIAWTLRTALPRYWKQIQLYLNIGSVREGERILLDGLPWEVKQINMFSLLENPIANLRQRVPLENLVDLKSRPMGKNEPWFPCKLGDWVIMNDGNRGKVIGISPEMVKLVQRGGNHLSYQMADFLAGSAQNLAANFRLKETIGIAYSLQSAATKTIPELLRAFIERRIEEDGWGDKLVNLQVEFGLANASALDLVVLADFKGDSADIYNKLRRAIQRWCVEACTEYGWEIPFQQVVIHGSSTPAAAS